MRGIFKVITTYLLGCVLCACTHDTWDDDDREGEETTFLSAVTKSGEGVESNIVTSRMIVFRSYTEGMGGGQLVVNHFRSGGEVAFKERVPVGTLDIYLIANERPEWNLSAVTSVRDLEQKMMTYTGYPVVDADHPIPMLGRYLRVKIARDGNTSMNGGALDLNNPHGTVERIFAKTTLDLSCLFADLPGGEVMTLHSVSVKRLPKSSYLIAQSYLPNNTEDFFHGEMADLSQVVTTPTGFSGKFLFYLPEYRISNLSRYSYISIITSLQSNPSIRFQYKLILGDGIVHYQGTENYKLGEGDVPFTHLCITRNTHYKFTAAIKSLGEIDGMEVHPDVEQWEPVGVSTDVFGRALNVSNFEPFITDINYTKIHFWSNQPPEEVSVLATGFKGKTGTEPFVVNDFFEPISGNNPSHFQYDYDPVTKTGTGFIELISRERVPGAYVHRIYLNSGGLKRELIVHTDVLEIPTWKIRPFVGTFHRWNEVGERIIHSAHTGAWSATVEDPEGLGSFVVLSDQLSFDQLLKSRSDVPGNAEQFPIKGGVKVLNGSGSIYFRIGLTSKLASQESEPRYARVRVNWMDGANPQTSYIYVRQGETPDYLMRPSDPINSGGMNSETRSRVVKFSPYNLSDPYRGPGGGRYLDGSVVPASDNVYQWILFKPEKFTDFPSQGGYFYQWNKNIAFHPFHVPGAVTEWVVNTTGAEFNPGFDVCPKGYRTPSDGSRGNTFVANSEIRQSLFSAPKNDDEVSTDNSIYGFYADGFFDRHRLRTPPGLSTFAYSAVSIDTYDIAFCGRLFFNPNNGASLFFPYAGERRSDNGQIQNLGRIGAYFTTTIFKLGDGNVKYFMAHSSNLLFRSAAFANSWRCVKRAD